MTGGVLLLDTIGELAALYALADVAFVGGSLVQRGGHNILEPAQHGVATVVGNQTENFRDIVSLFGAGMLYGSSVRRSCRWCCSNCWPTMRSESR